MNDLLTNVAAAETPADALIAVAKWLTEVLELDQDTTSGEYRFVATFRSPVQAAYRTKHKNHEHNCNDVWLDVDGVQSAVNCLKEVAEKIRLMPSRANIIRKEIPTKWGGTAKWVTGDGICPYLHFVDQDGWAKRAYLLNKEKNHWFLTGFSLIDLLTRTMMRCFEISFDAESGRTSYIIASLNEQAITSVLPGYPSYLEGIVGITQDQLCP